MTHFEWVVFWSVVAAVCVAGAITGLIATVVNLRVLGGASWESTRGPRHAALLALMPGAAFLTALYAQQISIPEPSTAAARAGMALLYAVAVGAAEVVVFTTIYWSWAAGQRRR
ncbi:MAG: hypothetical protein FJX75_16280 [Armatimonadetes bacterium]|nr:hypothetical protein [Armatimonadota bacterium]